MGIESSSGQCQTLRARLNAISLGDYIFDNNSKQFPEMVKKKEKKIEPQDLSHGSTHYSRLLCSTTSLPLKLGRILSLEFCF